MGADNPPLQEGMDPWKGVQKVVQTFPQDWKVYSNVESLPINLHKFAVIRRNNVIATSK